MVEAKPLVQAIINNLNNLKQKMTGLKGTARLLAVSKTKPYQDIQAAFEAGQVHFGENYIEEFTDKAKELPLDIQWHFIGHI